ncbi:putative DNA-directed RNA polymerase beta subunit [Serratia phage vB_SmaM-Kodama]|nr:putative DNA-directed RNA polymerase beta subunit [Serratia phage vB_SmaM-Kodama]
MKTRYARELVNWQEREIWAHAEDPEEFIIVFDDGELPTHWEQVLVSWYFWQYHREYPNVPLELKHFLWDDRLEPGMEDKLRNRGMNSVLAVHPETDREDLQATAYRLSNMLHNAFSSEGESYQASVDALALLQIHRDPDISKALNETRHTKAGINELYSRINKVLMDKPSLRFNPMVAANRNKQIKIAQFDQVVGARGFCSEIDQTIFPTMVSSGFSRGLHRLSHYLMCSRDASKAMQATDDPVKQTEYYNRELQLFTFVVKSIWVGDCGSTETVPWLVEADELDTILPGKRYVAEDGTLKMIKPSDRHLRGKVIQLRNVASCWHPDDGVICSTCMGDIGESIQRGTNLGHACTVTQNERVSQDVISTKHLLISATSEGFEVDPFYSEYLVNAGDISEIMFSTGVWDKRVEIEIDLADIPRLSDITVMKNLSNAELARFSVIRSLTLLIHNDDEDKSITTVIVPTSHGSYRPFLTEVMVKHMLDYGYETLGKKIKIDMTNWDNTESILRFPERHQSTLELMAELKSALFMSTKESKAKLRYDLTDPDILSMAMKDMCEMTNRKFSVNLAIVEMVLYAMMSRDPANGDYRLPKKGTGRWFDSKSSIMNGRSLSVKSSYEQQYEMLQSASSYTNPVRANHPFDHLLVDVEHWRRKHRRNGTEIKA